MADDQDSVISEVEFWEKAIELTEAVCSSSNITQPPQHLLPPPPPPHSVPYISHSPPRELSQRVKEDSHRNFTDKVFDCPVSVKVTNQGFNNAPPLPHPSRSHEEDKQQEINRLKVELGRVSKALTNLEQECLELRKGREKSENHLGSVLPLNGSKDSEPLCTKKSKTKNKDSIEKQPVICPGTQGTISCRAVGIQTDEHNISSDLITKKNLSNTYPLRKLADIWEQRCGQQPKHNLISKLFVACEADLQLLFGCLGLNIPSKKTMIKMDSSKHDVLYMAPNHCIQSVEAAKVSNLYLTLTKISYDMGRLNDLLEALVDLCCLQNTMIVHRSLCVLHVVLKHILSMENRSCGRDNVILNDPSTVNTSSEKCSETGHPLFENTNERSNPHHPDLTKLIGAKKIWNKTNLMDDSMPLISSSKWFSLFQTMDQIITRHSEEIIRLEAVSIMNIIVLRTDAYTEREMYGQVSVFQSISRLLRKEAGLGVQKHAVHLLYLLLNCPNLISVFCASFKEEGTTAEVSTENAKTALTLQVSGAILDGLADCLACRRNVASTILVLKLQRNAIVLLAFLASSGRHGFEILLGRNLPRRTNFLYQILQILEYEIDVEASESLQSSDDLRERTLLIREALILLNRLASNPQYSTPFLRVLTNGRDMAWLTTDVATRLSRKGKLRRSDTIRESEIVDLAQIFKKRVFTFLGETPSEK